MNFTCLNKSTTRTTRNSVLSAPDTWTRNVLPIFLVLSLISICSTSQPCASPIIKWQLTSTSEYSFTVGFSGYSEPEISLCAFAFSALPSFRFKTSLHIHSQTTDLLLPAVTIGAHGIYKNKPIQWLTFNIPENPQTIALTGEVVVTFELPVLKDISEGSIALDHGILTFPLSSVHTSKRSPVIPARHLFDKGVRLDITEDGIYKVYGRELQAIGVPIASIPAATYQLYEKGREIPILFSENVKQTLRADDFFLFYGKELRRMSETYYEQYSNTSVYHLLWGANPGVRVAIASGDRRKDPNDYSTVISIKAQEFRDTLHIEFDNDIRWLGNVSNIPPPEITSAPDQVAIIDNWYWGIVGDDNITTFSFNLPSPVQSGFTKLSIGLMGLTSIDSVNQDHNFTIYLNNNPTGTKSTARWDGQREYLFESDTFSSINLQPGRNSISFLSGNSTIQDRCALNWITISYQRDYKISDDILQFKCSPNAPGKVIEYELNGFSSDNIELWDIDNSRYFSDFIVKEGTGNKRNTYTLLFQDSITHPLKYHTQLTSKRKQVAGLSLDTFSRGWDTLKSVDYIVIAPDSFYLDCVPLMLMHQKRGLKTAFVSIDRIYNSFSWGNRDPEAIRTFLRFCFEQNASHPPRYVLLAGDTSHDLDKKNKSLNCIPTHLSRIPGWGPAADDGYFATVNGDDLFPDLCIGRFPVRNRTDLQIMVEKTCNYVTKTQRGFWKDNCLLLGGGDREFTLFNDRSTNSTIGSTMNVLRMDADPDSRFYKDAAIAPKHIADQINAGIFILNFNGHGGGNIWSDNNFFGYKDLSRLYNGSSNQGGRLPVVFSFTCLTGFFESTNYRSLGEEFMRNNMHGAICFYGASAYTSRNGNVILNRLMLQTALQDTFASIGDLINQCEMNMLVLYGSQYANLIQEYNLLGDPALPFRITPDTMKLSISKSNLSGLDSMSIQGTTTPINNGFLHIAVKSSDQEWYQSTQTISKSTFSETVNMKEGSHTASGIVRTYAWNDSAEVRRWVKFAKDSMTVTDVTLVPHKPAFGDSLSVSCKLSADSTAQVYCLFAQTSASYSPSFSGITMRPIGNGTWKTIEPIRISNSDFEDQSLIIQFRISSANSSRESEQFTYTIDTRSDLTFTSNSLKLFWNDDSLRTRVQILNAGNKASGAFDVVLLWGNTLSAHDTIKTFHYSAPLPPAGIINHTFSLPDTQNDISFTACIKSQNSEITMNNNQCTGFSCIRKASLAIPADTLFSKNRSIAIYPLTKFQRPHTLFLFTDSIKELAPLKSASSWALLKGGDSLQSYSIGYRPPLDMQDSLVWIFYPKTDTIISSGKPVLSVMSYDAQQPRWKRLVSNNFSNENQISCIYNSENSLALAWIRDIDGPEIQVSVYGRTLDFIDYAAKDKPFSIHISDPSEIVPSSVVLFINNTALSEEYHSSIPTIGDLENISITAYSPSSSAIDSLRIQATDFAGNARSRTFAYMPGKDLDVQFLSCHPNPFTADVHPDGSHTKIRFAYCITDIANSINLTIYTISGRPIRTWDFSNLIGYQEIAWDGRDRDGYRLANGTYYAKLTVKNKSRKIKKIIKIAKLEGY